MCYYRLHIYTTCGHSFWGTLVCPCHLLPISPIRSFDSHTQRIMNCPSVSYHPYQTYRINSLCLACRREREQNLSKLPAARPVNALWLDKGASRRTSKGLAELRREMRERKFLIQDWPRVPIDGRDESKHHVGGSTPHLNKIGTCPGSPTVANKNLPPPIKA